MNESPREPGGSCIGTERGGVERVWHLRIADDRRELRLLQADFKVGSDCFSNDAGPVTIARVDFPDVAYTVAYSISPALYGAGFVFQVGEEEATPETPGPLGGLGGDLFVAANQWASQTFRPTSAVATVAVVVDSG